MELRPDSHPTNGFPVMHKKISLDVKGNKTDIVICKYDDKFLVMVTQIGCMGTILHASVLKTKHILSPGCVKYGKGYALNLVLKEESEGIYMVPTFSISTIFGKRDEPLLVACARQLIEHISYCGSSLSLVLSLGVKDHSPGTLKDIIAAVIENRLW